MCGGRGGGTVQGQPGFGNRPGPVPQVGGFLGGSGGGVHPNMFAPTNGLPPGVAAPRTMPGMGGDQSAGAYAGPTGGAYTDTGGGAAPVIGGGGGMDGTPPYIADYDMGGARNTTGQGMNEATGQPYSTPGLFSGPGGPHNNGWGQDPTTMSSTSANPVGAQQMQYIRDTQAAHPGMAQQLAQRQMMHGNRGNKVDENGNPTASDPASMLARAQGNASAITANPGMNAFAASNAQFADPAQHARLAQVYGPEWTNGEVNRIQQQLATGGGSGTGPFDGPRSQQATADLQSQLQAMQAFQRYQQANPGVVPQAGPGR